jgi:hypothetical protein
MQPLYALPYTTSHTISSNQYYHTPNQTKMYMKKICVNDVNSDNLFQS